MDSSVDSGDPSTNNARIWADISMGDLRLGGTTTCSKAGGGGRLTVFHDDETTLPDVLILQMCQLMVEGARSALWCAIDHLRRHPKLGGDWNDVVDALAYHCFRYEAKDWPAKNDVDTMRRIFIRTLNGILGNQTVVMKDLSEDKAAGLTLMVKDKKGDRENTE